MPPTPSGHLDHLPPDLVPPAAGEGAQTDAPSCDPPSPPRPPFGAQIHSTQLLKELPVAATTQSDRRTVQRTSATRRLSTETKSAFKTTEFVAMVAVIVAILVSAAVIKGGDSNGTDEFIARQAWLYVAIVAAGYMISRGLAKSGSREPYDEDRTDRNRDDRVSSPSR